MPEEGQSTAKEAYFLSITKFTIEPAARLKSSGFTSFFFPRPKNKTFSSLSNENAKSPTFPFIWPLEIVQCFSSSKIPLAIISDLRFLKSFL